MPRMTPRHQYATLWKIVYSCNLNALPDGESCYWYDSHQGVLPKHPTSEKGCAIAYKWDVEVSVDMSRSTNPFADLFDEVFLNDSSLATRRTHF